MKMKEYDSLENDFSRVKFFSMALYTLVGAFIILMLFVPMFVIEKVKYFSIDDFKTLDEYYYFIKDLTPEEVFSGKIVEKEGISFLTELKYAFDNYSIGWSYILVISAIFLIIFEALWNGLKMFFKISEINSMDYDKYMRVKYKEAIDRNKTNNSRANKKDTWLNKSGIACFYEFIGSVAFYVFLMVLGTSVIEDPIIKNSAFTQVAYVSPFIIVWIVMIVLVIVFDFYLRKLNDKLDKAILEHNDNRNSNKNINTKQIQKSVDNIEKTENSQLNNNVETELQKYKDLFEKGLINKEEYNSKRKQLLDL